MTDPRLSIRAPEWLKDVNEQFLTDAVLPDVLTVPGRRSGLPRRVPLTVHEQDGRRYVVGGFPGADWIANVRAAGGRGEFGSQPVLLVEVDAAEAVAVLRAWPAVTPDGVEMMRDAGVVADTTPDACAQAVGICPVFRVEGTA